MKSIKGYLSIMSLPDIMQWAELSMKSGTLLVSSQVQSIVFFIQDGKIIFVSSLTEGSQLGGFLSKNRYVGEKDLNDAIQKSRKLGIQLTNYLISEKIIEKKRLEAALTQYAEDSFTEILNWKEGEFEFTPILPPNIINSYLKMNISYVMFQSVKSLDESKKDKTPDTSEIIKEIASRITGGDIELPPAPDMIVKLNEYMQRDDSSVQQVVRTIMADQILTSKILKVANSSFYAPPMKITTLHHAISYMGLKSIMSIVAASALTGVHSKNPKEIKAILRHSLLCAFVAKRIATILHLDPEEIFLCGLLHDIGKTVMTDLLSGYKLSEDVKKGLIQKYHDGAGYALATKWNLSDAVRSTARYHHEPQRAVSDIIFIETVFLANRIANNPGNFLKDIDYKFRAIDIAKIDFDAILKDMSGLQDAVNSIV